MNKPMMIAGAVFALLMMHVSSASATPVVSSGELYSGDVVESVASVYFDTGYNGGYVEEYWTFYAESGELVSLTVNRLETLYDPWFQVFYGIDDATWSYILLADDTIAELAGLDGPYSDPYSVFNIDTTGYYTIAVGGFLFNSGASGTYGGYDGPYYDSNGAAYRLTINGNSALAEVPEPGILGLLGLGLVGFGLYRRRA